MNSAHDNQIDQHLDTGDTVTYDSHIGGVNNKMSSTLKSFPDSSRSATGFGTFKTGNPLQLLSEILGQNLKLEGLADFKGQLPTIPINDLRGEEASAYSREECTIRRSLAALYRLVDIRGWTHSIYNHISVRCPDNPKHFLINPFGLLYHEIQASSLVKIDEDGNIIQQGSTVLGVNKAGWTLHSALHAARLDVNCIVHVHLPDVIAVSCIRAGLLPVSPEANELLSSLGVQYHDYHGILVDDSEKSGIQKDLGPKAKVLFLRNHGVAIAASSVAEAWYILKRVVTACQTQMRMLQLTGGASMLSDLKSTAAQLVDGTASRPFSELDGDSEATEPRKDGLVNGKAHSESGETSWTPAELEFEAEMRVLDSAGFRTGHVYRQPNLLRRTNLASTWAGDTLGDQATGADLFTTDFSATDLSAADDIAAAEAAGAQQVAKIMDSVKANRLKSVQRNQWLSEKQDFTAPGLVSSSMIASPGSNQSANMTPVVRPSHAYQQSSSPESPDTTPVKRPFRLGSFPFRHRGGTPSHPHSNGGSPLANGDSPIVTRSSPDQLRPANKSATLPATAKNRAALNAHTTNTLQSADGLALSGDEEKPKSEKKVKKKGSFRIPSFSRKKKH